MAEVLIPGYIYADAKLRNALRNRFPLAFWIEDYQAIKP